jgi:sulfopyruvate decarboxylase TPP-binding subunit
MIEARHFVEAARERGFHWYAGVPCSFLTPFINYVLQDPSLHYVSMANEGDAVALIAGIAIAGDAAVPHGRGITMMQNSGLGNAVSPLTSLTWTFRLPQLLIVTWRAQPGIADEPQHALMGPITPELLQLMQIPWELFPTETADIGPALDRATAHMDQTGRPYALVMQKGSVAANALKHGVGALVGPRAALNSSPGRRRMPKRPGGMPCAWWWRRRPSIPRCCWHPPAFAVANYSQSMIVRTISTWSAPWDVYYRWPWDWRWRVRTCA